MIFISPPNSYVVYSYQSLVNPAMESDNARYSPTK